MVNLGSINYKVTVDSKEAKKDLDKFNNSVQKGTKSTEQFGKASSKAGSLFKAGFVAAIVAGALKIGKHLVKVASEAEEIGNKFDVTFRDVQSSANKTAKELAKNYGLSQKAAKKLLSGTGDLLTGFGFTQEKALDLSTQVNKLAVDLGSFQNLETEDVSNRITSALTGEVESLKQLGVVIKQGSSEFKALVAAEMEATGATETQAKSQVILNQIMEQSKNSIGDFERSQNSFANQMKVAQANIDDLSVAFGDILLPIAGVGVSMFNDFAGELSEAGDALGEFIGQAENAKKIGDAVGTIAGYLTTVKDLGSEYILDIIEAFKLFLGPVFSLGGELDVVGLAMKFLSVWAKILGNVLKLTGSILGAMLGNLISTGQAVVEVVKSFQSLGKVIEGIKTGNLKLVKEGVKDIGDTQFEALMTHTGNVLDNFKKIGETAVTGFNEVKQAIADTATVEANYNAAKEKASKRTVDGLVKEQEAFDDAVKKNIEAKENEAEAIGEIEKTQTEKLAEELKKRQELVKQNLAVVAAEFESYSGMAMDFLGALNDIQDNVSETRIQNEQRQLEVNKQIWDAEAQAKIDSLDKSVLGEEEYAKQVEKITKDNNKKKLQADYALQMAKYQQELDSFKRSQALAVAQIWINQAVATMKAFAEMGWVGGLIVAAATSTIAAAQTAVVATQPPPVKPVKPAFAEGGIVNNPGPGIDAVVGEAGPEAIIPLNDDTLAGLASAIVEAQSATTAPTNTGGSMMTIIIPGIGEAVVNIAQEALDNRELQVPRTAFI